MRPGSCSALLGRNPPEKTLREMTKLGTDRRRPPRAMLSMAPDRLHRLAQEQRTAEARPPPQRKAGSCEETHSSGQSHGPGGAQDDGTALRGREKSR
jgi:hypothetical protein